MNRAMRRIRGREGSEVLVAERSCDGCGAPYCPRCDRECPECECCGEFNCELCGAYVLPAGASS